MTLRMLLLGVPDAGGDCWKTDLEQAGRELGWRVEHLPARGIEVEDVVRAAKGADLLVWARTHGHDPDGDAEEMLRRVEDAGTVTAGVHFDLYWGIPRREQRIGNEAWWSAQHVFTADGGERPWGERGINHHWLPPAFGTRFLGRGDAENTKRPYEGVFVGGCVRAIHGEHRVQLLDWGRRRWGPGFAHVGSRTHSKMWGERLSDLYAATGVVLGDSAPAPFYWSDRIPRTLGRGGLLAHPRTPGLEEQGFTGESMILFDRGRFSQIGEQLNALTDADRRAMTDAALTLVQERHLFRHRLTDIAQVVGLS